MNLVQIGAGSGNLDKNIEDGFTNFIEKKKIKGKIFFVDANSLHLDNLKKYWKKNRDVKIFNLGITSDNSQKRELTFFYSEDDKPDFQLFSSSFNFVKKHYPNSKILSKEVKCLNISTFLKQNNLYSVNFLSLDIEGMDFEVIHNLDFPFTRERRIAAGRDQNQPLSIWRKFVIPHRMTRRKFGINLFNERVVKTDTVQTIICHIGIAKTVGKVANRSFRIRGPGQTLNPRRLTLDL